MRTTVRLSATVLVLGTALAGCAGGSGDAKKVERAARSVTIDKRATCEHLTTSALATYAGERGPKAFSACKAKVKTAELPKSADIEVVKISGSQASVGYHTSDDVTGAMTLKKIKGRWLMDRVVTITP